MAKRSRRSAPPETTFTGGPWKGVYTNDHEADRTTFAFVDSMTNCYIEDTENGSDIVRRHGFSRHATQLGTASGRTVQCIHSHTKLDGACLTYVVCGGKIYETTNGTSYTDKTPASGMTISNGARVYMLSVGGDIVVNDGVNKPWVMGDPHAATPTATEIEYNTAGDPWTAYGKPTLYAAKVFFIAKTLDGVAARNAILWSEEAAPAVGYQQDGYDNLWELTQSDSDMLTAILGTNSALYYWRADSMGYIAGKVDTDFQTTATTDGVSLTTGTTAPGSVCVVGDHIWFRDRYARVWRFRPGGDLEPLWEQHRGITQAALRPSTNLEQYATTVHYAELGLVLMSYSTSLSVEPSPNIDVYAATTGRYFGQWSIAGMPGVDTLGLRYSNDGVGATALLLGGSGQAASYATATKGYIYTYHTLTSQVFVDDTTVPVTATVEVSNIGYPQKGVFYSWDQLDLLLRYQPSGTAVTATLSTSHDAAGTSITPTRLTPINGGDMRYVAGLNRQGRYINCTITFGGWDGTYSGTARLASLSLRGRVTPLSTTSP